MSETMNRKTAPFDPRDIITPEAFSVQPELLGTPLAKPRKRLFAWAVDALVVALMAKLSNVFLAMALAWMCDQVLRKNEFSLGLRWQRRLRLSLVVLFLGWAALEVVAHWLPQITPVFSDDGGAIVATDSDNSADDNAALTDQQKIAALSDKIEKLQAGKSGVHVIDTVKNMLGDIGFDFGWAAVYWTLLTSWWGGQTLGKRLFGLRVVQLNGKPLSMWDCFNRCGGYAAGVATGLLGFAQVWWDPNRQAIHDKVAFTVVIDTQRSKQSWRVSDASDELRQPRINAPQ